MLSVDVVKICGGVCDGNLKICICRIAGPRVNGLEIEFEVEEKPVHVHRSVPLFRAVCEESEMEKDLGGFVVHATTELSRRMEILGELLLVKVVHVE